MSRIFPPSRIEVRLIGRWRLALVLAALPLSAIAEVTLTTSIEKVSSAVPASENVAATPAALGVDGTAAPATAAAPGGLEMAPTPAGAPSEVFPGDVLRYTITFENTSTQDVAPGSVVITNPLPEETVYLEGSALGEDTLITFSVDGTTFASPADLLVGEGAATRAATASDFRAIRWTYEPLLPAGASSQVSFELLIP